MPDHPTFRKVFSGIASREQMLALFDHHRDEPGIDPVSGTPYAGEWFEIRAAEYHFMEGLLPPLPARIGMMGLAGYRAGYVTSIFLSVRIRGRERWFHGFCDLSYKHIPDAMRAAIVAFETTDRVYEYRGKPGTFVVTFVDEAGLIHALDPRLDLRNHSPTGFSWGYGGSGPAQLALAILSHALNCDERAEELYQAFKDDVVSQLDQNKFWRLTTDDVLAWVLQHSGLPGAGDDD